MHQNNYKLEIFAFDFVFFYKFLLQSVNLCYVLNLHTLLHPRLFVFSYFKKYIF